MPILTVVLVLITIGVLLWAVNSFLPMEGRIKQILNAVVVIATVLWVLSLFFNVGAINQIHVGRP